MHIYFLSIYVCTRIDSRLRKSGKRERRNLITFRFGSKMSKPQVTITLGRTGQRVVRRPRTLTDDPRTDPQLLSGSKRSMREGIGSSSLPLNKRLRGDVNTWNPGYNGRNDARVGQSDLRLKLMRKKLSRQIRREAEEEKKMYLHEKMSRSIRSPERSLLRRIPPTRSAGEFLPVESLRKSYTSYNVDGFRSRSPDRLLTASRRISPPRNFDEMRRVPLTRSIDASRTGRGLGNDVLDPSRPMGPAPTTMRATMDAGKPVAGLSLPNGSMPRSSYMIEQPLTVGGLLHSLGLGKYGVLFQAEEVDMAALKQMGDKDLKELGIPMGPRKKILLALLPRPKRQPL